MIKNLNCRAKDGILKNFKSPMQVTLYIKTQLDNWISAQENQF